MIRYTKTRNHHSGNGRKYSLVSTIPIHLADILKIGTHDTLEWTLVKDTMGKRLLQVRRCDAPVSVERD